jgi:hypothetical protein
MPGNNESETLQVLTDLYGADDMNNFSVFQVSYSLKMVETTCKTSSLTTHQTYKNVEKVKKLVCTDRQTV